MPNVRAVLLDVFETVLTVDFEAALVGLVAASGLSRDEWARGLHRYATDLMTGATSLEEPFAGIFQLAGKSAGDLPMLVQRDRELLQEHVTVGLRSRTPASVGRPCVCLGWSRRRLSSWTTRPPTAQERGAWASRPC